MKIINRAWKREETHCNIIIILLILFYANDQSYLGKKRKKNVFFRQIFFEIVERQALRRNYRTYLLFIPFIHISNHNLFLCQIITGSVQLIDEMNLKILSQVSVCVRISCRIYGTDALGVESCFIFPDCCRIDALPFD